MYPNRLLTYSTLLLPMLTLGYVPLNSRGQIMSIIQCDLIPNFIKHLAIEVNTR